MTCARNSGSSIYNSRSVKPEMDAAVEPVQIHNSVTANLNYSLCNIFVVIPEKLFVLY